MENEMHLLADGPRQYVTSTVSLLDNDSIVIHVLNFSEEPKTLCARIYTILGEGSKQVKDSGDIQLDPKCQWSLAYNVVQGESGQFWVQLDFSSEMLIPKVSFERNVDNRWLPFVFYNPGDFAVFEVQQRRIR